MSAIDAVHSKLIRFSCAQSAASAKIGTCMILQWVNSQQSAISSLEATKFSPNVLSWSVLSPAVETHALYRNGMLHL